MCYLKSYWWILNYDNFINHSKKKITCSGIQFKYLLIFPREWTPSDIESTGWEKVLWICTILMTFVCYSYAIISANFCADSKKKVNKLTILLMFVIIPRFILHKASTTVFECKHLPGNPPRMQPSFCEPLDMSLNEQDVEMIYVVIVRMTLLFYNVS